LVFRFQRTFDVIAVHQNGHGLGDIDIFAHFKSLILLFAN
jgi:hypothetical protein